MYFFHVDQKKNKGFNIFLKLFISLFEISKVNQIRLQRCRDRKV